VSTATGLISGVWRQWRFMGSVGEMVRQGAHGRRGARLDFCRTDRRRSIRRGILVAQYQSCSAAAPAHRCSCDTRIPCFFTLAPAPSMTVIYRPASAYVTVPAIVAGARVSRGWLDLLAREPVLLQLQKKEHAASCVRHEGQTDQGYYNQEMTCGGPVALLTLPQQYFVSKS
jgi:hypothetical protein